LKQAVSKFLNHVSYRILALILVVVTKILFRTRIEGRENIPANGAIVVARHKSFWDIPLVVAAVHWNRQVTFVARETLNEDHPILRPVLSGFSITVNRENFGLSDFRLVMKAIRANKLVSIFPEGTIHQTGKVFTGVVRFAEQSGKDFLPIRFKIRKGQYGPKYPFGFPALTLVVGRPFSVRDLAFDLNGQESKQERYLRLSELLMKRIDNAEPN